MPGRGRFIKHVKKLFSSVHTQLQRAQENTDIEWKLWNAQRYWMPVCLWTKTWCWSCRAVFLQQNACISLPIWTDLLQYFGGNALMLIWSNFIWPVLFHNIPKRPAQVTPTAHSLPPQGLWYCFSPMFPSLTTISLNSPRFCFSPRLHAFWLASKFNRRLKWRSGGYQKILLCYLGWPAVRIQLDSLTRMTRS